MKCKKSIYKSTYKRNAFTKGKNYFLVEEDELRYWVRDELGNPSSFTKKETFGEHLFSNYFSLKKTAPDF
jgi:hypothetical protein